MTQYLYPIFQTSAKNGCNDLVIALAMFLSDARLGKQQYGPDGVDYEQLHADYEQLCEQERDLRLFIARHYDALVRANRLQDEQAFREAVARCEEKDAAAAAAREAKEQEQEQEHADLP